MEQSERETVTESPDSTVAVDEQPVAEPEAAPESVTDAAPTNGGPDPTRGFLAELAHAMRGAAERERERISADVDTAAEAHVEKVRARAATEAAELRRLADQDIDGIHSWSKEETIRIQQDTERRIGTRREELKGYLIRHAAIIDGEVGHIEGAVREYRAELDRFFAQLASESDPSGLARVADAMPAPPDLNKVGSSARAQAVAALAEEQHAADAGVADAVASAEVNANAFDPEQPGPELVPVMGESNGTVNATAVVASVVASGDKPTADAASTGTEESTEADADSTTEHPNVAVRLLRSIASTLSAPAEHPTAATEATETPEPAAADESATKTDEAKS